MTFNAKFLRTLDSIIGNILNEILFHTHLSDIKLQLLRYTNVLKIRADV